MKLKINKKDLASLIASISTFASKKDAIMSFEVQAKMLIASGFDDSAGLKAVVPADVTLDEDEKVTAFGLSLGVFAELGSTFAIEGDITFTFE